MSNIPSVEVARKLLSLAEAREALLKKVAAVETEILSLVGKRPAPANASRTPSRKPRERQGSLKTALLEALSAAGKDGIGTKELAEKIGRSSQTVSVWFSSTGKKHAERIGRGRWRIKSA